MEVPSEVKALHTIELEPLVGPCNVGFRRSASPGVAGVAVSILIDGLCLKLIIRMLISIISILNNRIIINLPRAY